MSLLDEKSEPIYGEAKNIQEYKVEEGEQETALTLNALQCVTLTIEPKSGDISKQMLTFIQV